MPRNCTPVTKPEKAKTFLLTTEWWVTQKISISGPNYHSNTKEVSHDTYPASILITIKIQVLILWVFTSLFPSSSSSFTFLVWHTHRGGNYFSFTNGWPEGWLKMLWRLRLGRAELGLILQSARASLEAQMVKNLTAMQETQVWCPGWEDPLEREWQPTPVLLPRESHGKETWWAIVHGVAKRQTRLSD